MVHYDEEQYEWLCKTYGQTTGHYYKGRQIAYEQIDDIIAFCQGKLKSSEMIELLDIAYPHAKESESNK